MKKRRRLRKGLAMLLSLAMVAGLVPAMSGGANKVQAATGTETEPSVSAYATRTQLMDGTFAPNADGTAVNIGKLVFGKNSSGASQEWYILGKDEGVSGDNTIIFAASPIAEEQVFSSKTGDKTYNYEAGTGYGESAGSTTVFANHYGASDLRVALQGMATNPDYFTTAEQGLMNATTVTTNDDKNSLTYTTTDKLYALQGDYKKKKCLWAGSSDSTVLAMSSYWSNGNGVEFWSRSPHAGYSNYALCADPGYYVGVGFVNWKRAVQPASNLNLSFVLFASAATAASSDTAESHTIASGTTMTLRLNGTCKNIGTVTYNATTGDIKVARGSTSQNVALVVQGKGTVNGEEKDWYYSKQMTGKYTENVSVSNIEAETNTPSSIDLSTCKIWLEITDTDGLIYAVGAYADKEIEKINTTYVTKEQLMNSFKPNSDGTAVNYGKLVFGKNKNSNREPQEWHILGKDEGISGDNTIIFAASSIAEQTFEDDRINKTESSLWSDCDYSGVRITEVYPNHYGASDFRVRLKEMAKDTSYFTPAEQGLMNATTVTTKDEKNNVTYTTTDKLYALQGERNKDKLWAGTSDSTVLAMSSYWSYGGGFWLRSTVDHYDDYDTRYALLADTGYWVSRGNIDDYYFVRPASNLNLSSVLFASSAKASPDTAEAGQIAEGTAMTLRLNGTGKDIGTVTYNTTTGDIKATKGTTSQTVFLVVQGKGTVNGEEKDWYYSKEIKGTKTVNASAIKSALSLSSDINLSDCKIWLETTDSTENLIYAVGATEVLSITSVEITGIDIPVSNTALDTKASCTTTGVSSTTPQITWTPGDSTAGDNISYTASITLTADTGYEFIDSTTATVLGNTATSVIKNVDGTLTVTYAFPARKDKLTSITANPTAGNYSENQSVTLTSDTEGATIYYTTDGSEPTITGGVPGGTTAEYKAPIAVTGTEGQSITTTIKAIAVKNGMQDSNVETFTYTIQIQAECTYATKTQLMDGTFTPKADGTAVNYGKIVFGKNSSGNPQEWYILGKDNGVLGDDNTIIFAASPIAKGQKFNSDKVSRTYNYEAGTGYGDSEGSKEVYANHYGASDLRAALQRMLEDEDGNTVETYFSEAEQGLMNATTVTTKDTKNSATYTTTDKLYALAADGYGSSYKTIKAGTSDSTVLAMNSYRSYGGGFWLRSPSVSFDDDALLANQGNYVNSIYVIIGWAVQPASNLNLSSVLFASSAKAASSDTVESHTIASGTAMTLRLNGTGKNIGTVTYNTTTGDIKATKGSTEGDVALVVQGKDGTNDWYYSKKITGTEVVNVTDIVSESNTPASIDLSTCKIWLETTDSTENLIYAVGATEVLSITSVEITGIEIPVSNTALDNEAACVTTGVSSAKPHITWTPNDSTAGYNKSYTASITLTADTGYEFTDSTTATVLDNSATSVNKNTDGTLTVTYDFPATDKDKLTSITAPQPITVANGTAYSAMNLPEQVNIVTDGNTVSSAPVTWNTTTPADGSYDPAVLTEQTVTLTGTVTCPDSIDANEVSLTTTITITISAADTVKAPTANPTAGAYTKNQSVTLTSDTAGATIYYTTDGSEPTITGGMLGGTTAEYTAPIAVTGTEGQSTTTTIKAIAVKDRMQNSSVETFTYTIQIPDAPHEHVDSDNDGICEVCQKRIWYIVSPSSMLLERGVSVSNISMNPVDGKVKVGESVTVTTQDMLGYSFKGWYLASDIDDETKQLGDNANPQATSFTYTFKPEDNMSLVAVYEAAGNADVKISGSGFTVSVDDGAASAVQDGTYSDKLSIGSKVTITIVEENSNFINWTNENNKIVSTERTYTFTVTGQTTLTMSKKGTTGSTAMVEFVSAYNQVISGEIYSSTDTISFPDGPSKMGYIFKGWSLSEDEIHTKISEGETHITVTPVCEQDTRNTYTVTIYIDGVQDDTQTETGILSGTTKTVKAPTVDGRVFLYWTDADGNILGYDPSYFMQVNKDIVVKAVYGEAAVEAKPVIAMTNVFTTSTGGKNKISFTVTRDIPEGYTLVEHGVLYNKLGTIDNPSEETFVLGGTGVSKYTSTATKLSGIVTLNVNMTGVEDTKVVARGYMIVKNSEGKDEIYYSDYAHISYNERK